MSDPRRRAWQFLVLIFIVYVVSFVLPVFGSDFLGVHSFIYALLYCWCPPMSGLCWFANVALWIGFAYLNSECWPQARRCGLIGLALGLTIVPIWWKHETFQIGYYVWMCSIALLSIGAIHCEAFERRLVLERRRRLAEERGEWID